MVPEADHNPAPIYAQFDGDQIDDKRYDLGEPIDRDRHSAGTIAYLEGIGRLGGSKPTNSVTIDATVPVSTLTRAQLLAEISHEYSDDNLREMVTAKREHEAGRIADERGAPAADADADAPILNLSVPKFKAVIDAIEALDRLAALRAGEEAKGGDKVRSGALAAIDARTAEIKLAAPDYERDGLGALQLDQANAAQLRTIAKAETVEVADDADDAAVIAAIEAKRG